MFDHTTRISIVALLSLTTVGCASLGGLARPELALVDLQMVDATLFETTLQAQLRIANANAAPMIFEGATFRLSLEGVKVARGMTSETIRVPRLGSELVEVTFHLNHAALMFSLRDMLERDSLAYGLRGKLFVKQAFGTRKLKVQRQGRLDLPVDS